MNPQLWSFWAVNCAIFEQVRFFAGYLVTAAAALVTPG